MAVSTPVYTHTIQTTYRDSDSLVITASTTAAGDTKIAGTYNVAAGATAQEADISITASALKSIILSTSGPALVVTPYNGATAGTVINIPANGSIMWNTSSGGANPISANVTKFLIANTAAAPAAAAALIVAGVQVLSV